MRHFTIALGVILIACVSPALASEEVLKELNARRASRGLQPYVYDSALDKECEQNCEYRVRRRITGHVTSVPPLRCSEGVGWGGKAFHSCFAFTSSSPGCKAGAASRQCKLTGRWYHTLRLRGSHGPSSGASNRCRGPFCRNRRSRRR